jgi:hypothetical protein
LIFGEGVSCSSETKHDRRTAPRSKLFVSKRRLQKQRPIRRQTVLGSIPARMVSVARKLSTVEERRQDQSFFVLARRLQEERPTTGKTALSSSPDVDDFCNSETMHERTEPRHFFFGKDITGTKVTNSKTVLSLSLDDDSSCCSRPAQHHFSSYAQTVRETILNYFNSVGSVPWQNDYALPENILQCTIQYNCCN